MDAKEVSNEGPKDETGGTTLGDVLYADRTASVPEQDWVTLVTSIAEGNEAALHALYERMHRLVFTLSMRITRSRETAEEVTLDVFHDVWRRASTYDPSAGTVIGWIMNQARSRAIDRVRFEQRKKRVNPQPEHPPEEAGHSSDPHEALHLDDRARLLRQALTVLTPPERQAIETAFFTGLTYSEAAVRLHEPPGTVKTRIRSGLRKLRETLSSESTHA